jgi:hypothetical protein
VLLASSILTGWFSQRERSAKWDIMPCSLVECNRRFGGSCCCLPARPTFYLKDGSSAFLRNVNEPIPGYMRYISLRSREYENLTEG